jgi:anti-sigma factor ChrR (cupin superfamily)
MKHQLASRVRRDGDRLLGAEQREAEIGVVVRWRQAGGALVERDDGLDVVRLGHRGRELESHRHAFLECTSEARSALKVTGACKGVR